MAGHGFYFVGPNQPYQQIQEAINALMSDQGTDTFTDEQQIVVAENGIYEPFRIEPDALRPDSAARLTIKSAAGIQAVISGRKNPTKASVGALIGNNVPYVTLERFFFRDVKKGAVVGVNSHRAVINQCVFLQCGNVGAWVYEAEEALIANSVFVNHGHGIAAINTRSISIIHNTLFNDTGFTTKEAWLIYLDLQDDRGNGVEDAGQLHLYNNILYAQGGGALLIYEKDLSFIASSHNDWWTPGNGPLVEIREGREDGTVHRDRILRLVDWQLRSGQDEVSYAEDPGFIKPAANDAGASIDLKLLKVSPLIRKGKLLCGDPTNDLPSYFDDAILCTDFNGKSRTSTPTIGANEVNATNSFYGHSVFLDTSDEVDDALVCGDQFAAYDRATGVYASAVPAWFPKVHAGYFYVRDIEYYLYAQKAAYYLEDIQQTSFPLSAQLLEDGVEIWVTGVDVTATAVYEIADLVFTLDHKGLGVADLSQEVELRGYYQAWSTTSQAFERRFVRHRWHFNDGMQRYVLPTNPINGTPVVVTDDTIRPHDQVGLAQQFRLVYNAELNRTEVDFGPHNLWQNPEFAYDEEQYEYTGTLGLLGAGQTGELYFDPLRGDQSVLLPTGDQWFGQRFAIDPESPYFFSAYASALGAGTGHVGLAVEFFDHEQISLGEHGPFAIPLEASTGWHNEWTRFGLQIRAVPDDTPGRTAPDLSLVETGLSVPTSARSMLVRVLADTGLPVAYDAFMLTEGYSLSPYLRLPRGTDCTVEYESDDSGFYTVEDLTLHPVRNAQPAGFLAVVPQPAEQFETGTPSGSTTLSDNWPNGRLEFLPWARTSAFNKYRQVGEFSLERSLATPDIAPEQTVPVPKTVRFTPDVLVARQGSAGEAFAVEVFDDNDNAYAFGKLKTWITDATGEFPGYLSRQEWGYFTQLGQLLEATLNEAGAQMFTWIPPEQEDVEYRGDAPDVTGGIGYVDTYYRVYPPNHGDPVLRDQFDTKYISVGNPVTGYFGGTVGQDATRFQLTGFPTPGSVHVWSDITGGFGIHMSENFQPPLRDHEFAVDYENGTVSLHGQWYNAAKISYEPRLIWRDPRFPRRLYISETLLDGVEGDISIQYDALVSCIAQAQYPENQLDLTGDLPTLVADFVAQHNDRGA